MRFCDVRLYASVHISLHQPNSWDFLVGFNPRMSIEFDVIYGHVAADGGPRALIPLWSPELQNISKFRTNAVGYEHKVDNPQFR